MSHLLVLQVQDDSVEAFDSMISLEDELIEHMGGAGDIDGHDVGSGTINIFIFTNDPGAAFLKSKPLLQRFKMLDSVIVAHRPIEDDDFTVIWPEGYSDTFKVL